MKKILKGIRNFILGVLLFIYLSFIIIISTLLLNRNDYGMTQFKDKALILVTNEVANEKYQEGSLVIVKEEDINNIKEGDEVFIYKSDKKTKTVKVVISKVGKINLEATSPYVVLANDGTAWGEDFIAGKAYAVYDHLGTLLSFIESKWIFFSLLIVPCFFILLYEIHLVIVTIKFGDEDEFEEDDEEAYKNQIDSKDEKIEELMKQIQELKKEKKETSITKKKTTTKKKESEKK